MAYSWIKRLALICMMIEGVLTAYETSSHSEDEVLFVRRIMEFWKDHETDLVKVQIKDFLNKYPQSQFTDNLLVILGDIYWKNKQYQEALNAYYEIENSTVHNKVFPNQIDSLYHLGQYTALVNLIKPRLEELNKANLETSPDDAVVSFYYAEGLRNLAKNHSDPEQAKGFYKEAKAQYERLIGTEYNDNAKLALGEILVPLGDPKHAVTYFKDLAATHPEKKEEMLLQAARIQALYAPDEALEALNQLQKNKSNKSSEAALSKLLLLFEQGYYQQLINERAPFKRSIPASQEKILDFFVGRSYFALKKYKEAMDTLISLLPPDGIDPAKASENEKILLLTLIAAAHYQNDLPLVKEWSTEFEEIFPHEPEFAKVLYIQGLTCKNCDFYEDAQKYFDRLVAEHADFDKLDSVEFDKNVMLFKQGKWEQSRKGFIDFAQKYPHSLELTAAYQYIPNSTLQMLEEAEKSHVPTDLLREQLIADMQLVLNAPGAVTSTQKAKYWLKMGKTFYDLKRYQNAIDILQAFVKEYPRDPNIYQAHLLMAMSCQQVCQNPKDFVFHAEKALSYQAEFADRDRLQQNLFNAYLKLAKAAEDAGNLDKQSEYIARASNHLYDVFVKNPALIKSENQIWLANYFYNQAKIGLNEYLPEPTEDALKQEKAKKALYVYHSALGIPEEFNNLSQVPRLSSDKLMLESELLKLANLYAWLNQYQQQALLLESLSTQQKDTPDLKWLLRSRTALGLAYAKEKLEVPGEAMEIYAQIIAQPKGVDPNVSSGAKLHYARLAFDELANEDRTLDNPKAVEILNLLKDLQIKKAFQQEPTHLEAAIDYAYIRAALGPEEKKLEQTRFLLARAKQDFTSKEDVAAKDYHAGRDLYPAKGLIYEAYLMLIDADLARLDAKIAESRGATHEKEMKLDAARALYKNLIQGKFAVTNYVIDQAKLGLESLKSS